MTKDDTDTVGPGAVRAVVRMSIEFSQYMRQHNAMRDPVCWEICLNLYDHVIATGRGSNAKSLAMATGIPYETVRRKLNILVATGWCCRIHGKETKLTEMAEEKVREHAVCTAGILRRGGKMFTDYLILLWLTSLYLPNLGT